MLSLRLALHHAVYLQQVLRVHVSARLYFVDKTAEGASRSTRLCVPPLQGQWLALKDQAVSSGQAGADACVLLQIIAAVAARFPVEEAATLSTDLLKVTYLLTRCGRSL